MIFTSYRKTNIIKQNIINLNYKLLDINLIFTDFESIKKNLKYKTEYIPNHITKLNFENDDSFCFEYITESNGLILPLYYRDYIDYPTKNIILNFNKFMLDKYSGVDELKVLIEQLILNIDIPCEILIKYWLHLYTLESDFYKEMNYCLKNNIFEENYDTYIKVLYTGLLKKYILPFTESVLYRGSIIGKTELEFINNSLKNKISGLPGCICYSKGFLSFTSVIDVAYAFMVPDPKKDNKDNKEYVLYEIQKGNKIYEENASNTNVEKIAKYDEKETLFFPFSSFEINQIEEREYKNKKYYHIFLSYLGKYKEKVDKTEKIPETDFAKRIMKTEVLDKIEMQQEQNKFTFLISDYISEEKKKELYKSYL